MKGREETTNLSSLLVREHRAPGRRPRETKVSEERRVGHLQSAPSCAVAAQKEGESSSVRQIILDAWWVSTVRLGGGDGVTKVREER